ncbi:unnamed protein product [Notodromas monacha]|uniref:BHLH domain-containing protein n=1 Tax=Notodromas monacha TaxID=399045 RepID=A0A7R9BKV1_9CRUS|nr:unnamed protein product [Notodromas monacha]CAG0916509.1 unnamed protein product [Notodromas monacha]
MATTSLLTQRPADCCWPQQRPGSNISDFFRSWHPNDSMANPFNQVTLQTLQDCADAVLPTASYGASSDQRQTPSPGRKRTNSTNEAEHKKRMEHNEDFEALQRLIPALNQTNNPRISKARSLEAAAEHLKTLKSQTDAYAEEIRSLKSQIESLTGEIDSFQSQLPATGAPISQYKTNKVRDYYKDHVKQQTLKSWKFWMFSKIVGEHMAKTFNESVANATSNNLSARTMEWAEKHCNLVAMRSGALGALRKLGTETSVLSNPELLKEEAVKAVLEVELASPATLSPTAEELMEPPIQETSSSKTKNRHHKL